MDLRGHSAFGVAAGTGWLAVTIQGCPFPREDLPPDVVCEPTRVLVSDDPLPATTSQDRAPTGDLGEVAAGDAIDPESLQVIGRTVTWTDDGVRRSYVLGTRDHPAAITRSGSPYGG